MRRDNSSMPCGIFAASSIWRGEGRPGLVMVPNRPGERR